MTKDAIHRASHWILRAMEWDDTRAKYPNIWRDEMPRHVLVEDRRARRLRLGDLIAVYCPSSTKHSRRSERYVGISRVVGLRDAGLRGVDDVRMVWVDLETAHRFRGPLDLGRTPERVFLCCDPGWPASDVALFDELMARAEEQGWKPQSNERSAEGHPQPERKATDGRSKRNERQKPEPPPSTLPVGPWIGDRDRLFAGVDFSGDMRDPRAGTWLAVVAMADDALRVVRLEATGRTGLQSLLRNLPRDLTHAEAVGMGFPFGLPVRFAESLMDGPFPAEGWWALARRLERVSWPDYLVALQEFREAQGEILRLADERAQSVSPLHRVDPDMGSRFYHGIRMIAEDRSRFAIRPFESAQGKLLFEVCPDAVARRLDVPAELHGKPRQEWLMTALAGLERWPLKLDPPYRAVCASSGDALDAVIAARCATVAVLTAEVEKTAAELAPENAERVRFEGWIYGLHETD